MFIALNKDNTPVFACHSLPKEEHYRCPVCEKSVRLRIGESNAPHFAHINLDACPDDFAHDMSEWHRAWQALFPIRNREVVVTNGTETHRADVLCYGTVIEFQHSPISEREFWRRNNFFTSSGYKVIWIFDATKLGGSINDDGRISCKDEWNNQWDNGGKFRWKNPWRFLGSFMPQNEVCIEIFFHFTRFEDLPNGNPKDRESGYIEKVIWVNPNHKTSWGWFHTSYRIGNYYELLEYLKKRYTKRLHSPPYR